jgi:predicted acetyltransferase
VLSLIEPSTAWQSAWLAAHDEWGPGWHEDGFGLSERDEVRSAAGFAEWVSRLRAQQSEPGALQKPRLACQYRWIVEDGRVLGGIALRHGTDASLNRIGHVGYGIRPSARRRGVAAWALIAMVTEAGQFGLSRVLVVCAAGNAASAATAERAGGVLEGIERNRNGAFRRYWIDV